jgi:hypothetical protein
MSLTKELLDEISRANSLKSTGPRSIPGKQRSRMNAVKHNLSGQHLILLEAETEAYNRMATSMLIDLKPKSEPERQIAQKIIDTNFRLNRLTSIENNMFSFGLMRNETDTAHDDRIEVMAAQARAWIERANSFDVLGRYESRLSRQLLKYQEEFERLQAVRKERERIDSTRSPDEIKRDEFDPASFGQVTAAILKGPDFYRILTHLPPPKSPDRTDPGPTTDPCTAGDLDQERSTMVSLVQDKVTLSAAPVANGVLPNNMAA